MPCGGKTILRDKNTTICCGFVRVETAAYGGYFSTHHLFIIVLFSAEFLMEHENMNRQEEYQSDGDAAM